MPAKITESQKELILKQQDKLLGKIKDTSEMFRLRKSIAQMKTILDEKLTRIDGLILLLAFAFYAFWIFSNVSLILSRTARCFTMFLL